MKIPYKLFLFFLIPINLFAQKIDFKDNMQEAIKFSIKKNKPIFMFIETPNAKIETNVWFEDDEIVNLINENFIAFKTSFLSEDAREITKKYTFINKYPAFVFLHNNKEVFFNDFGTSTFKQKYVKIIQDAVAASSQKKLSDYEQEYNDKKDSQSLKAFIAARQKQGIIDNAALIETYASLLTIADFNDYKTVLFVLQSGPYVDGKAYKLAYTNRKVVDSIYKNEPVQVRSDINRNVLVNTMKNAQNTKNIMQAQAAASYARRMSGANYQTGAKNYSGQMLNYFIAVNDTTNYLKSAVSYFDSYYMNLSADSIKKLELVQSQAALERSRPIIKAPTISQAKMDSIKASPNTVVRRESFTTSVVSMRNAYANALNGAAYKFYETGTTNINYLTKAMIWSRRSLELKQDANYYDTLAHILYRLGYVSEAVKTEETAINQAKIDGRPYENMQEELRKFKSKKS
jgi:hypothetical protein